MALLSVAAAGLARRGGRWAAMVSLLLGSLLKLPAETSTAPDYQLKAVFLFNFAQFTDWPAKAFADAQAPLVIGVLGEDFFGPYLGETVRGEKANNRPLLVQHYRRIADIRTCHVLFISRSEMDRLEQIFQALPGRSILTVSDIPNFAARGGMIELFMEKNKIRMRINLAAVKAADLNISSKLLRLAETRF